MALAVEYIKPYEVLNSRASFATAIKLNFLILSYIYKYSCHHKNFVLIFLNNLAL